MQARLNNLKAFDFVNSTAHLWVFKTSTSARRYSAWYVQTDGVLNSYLKTIAANEMARIEEIAAYGHLADVNEISCLTLQKDETDFHFLKDLVDRIEPDFPVRGIEDLKGATGYVVKFTHNGHTVYSVRRSIANWKTSYPTKYINVIFRNGELSAAENDSFSIEKNFDFFILDDDIFISNKKAFETVLKYRTAYESSFAALQVDASFGPLFADMAPLMDFVGTNAMHLRRMAAVAQKSLYADPLFLVNLQRVNNLRNWGLNFDPATGQIIVCDQTAKRVIEVLLDHLLMSEVTANSYLVPDATLQP